MIEFGDLKLDIEKKILLRNGKVVALPLKAVELLTVLVENAGEVVPKDELMKRVWQDAFVEDSVLTQNIYILRKTLKVEGADVQIKNVPRRGYLLVGSLKQHFENGKPEQPGSESSNGKIAEIKSPTAAVSLKTPRIRFPKRSIVLMAAAFVILAVGFGSYKLMNPGSRHVTQVPGPLRLKPVAEPSAVKILAVLHFDSDLEYLGEQFASDLAVRLASANKFKVISSSLIREYQTHNAEIPSDLFLAGRVIVANGKYFASVRLAETRSNGVLWSDNFEYDDLIQLQDAVSNSTALVIQESLTDTERAAVEKRLPTNHAAYQAFEAGYLAWRKRRNAEVYLRKAIELDQSFAPAYALLASQAAMLGSREEADKLLQKAVDLDDNLADVYAVQGFIRIFHVFDWEGAEKSLRNALEHDQNHINARHWLSVLYSLLRRMDAAKEEMEKALELDPTNPTLIADLGQLHYFVGDDATALALCNKALEIDPAHIMARGYIDVISEPKTNDRESLLTEAEAAMSSNSFILPYLNIHPKFDPVREDARFQEILRKIGL